MDDLIFNNIYHQNSITISILVEQYINQILTTLDKIIIRKPTNSTMEFSSKPITFEPITIKFPKCNSSDSIRTQAQTCINNPSAPKKIPQEKKKKLIHLITVENYNMKEAAKLTEISYSTAKKIFMRFRKALRLKTLKREKEDEGKIRCSYTIAAEGDGKRVMVVCSLAGNTKL